MAELICNLQLHPLRFSSESHTVKHLRHYSPLTCNLGQAEVGNKILSVWVKTSGTRSDIQHELALLKRLYVSVFACVLDEWMTHRSTMNALVVEECFLQGEFLRSNLLPGHILSAVRQEVSLSNSEVTQVHCLLQHLCTHITAAEQLQALLRILDSMLFILEHTYIHWICLYFSHPSMVLPWCPQDGSPPPSSPAASLKSPPGCFPLEA